LGEGVFTSITTGANNVAVGYNSMNATTTGDQNVAVGGTTLLHNTTGGANTAIGSRSMETNTIGSANTAVGQNSMLSNTTGANNVAIGAHALQTNTIGTDNVAAGFNALAALTTGTQNSACGTNTLENLTTGSSNTALGLFAGQNASGASANNIYINNIGAVESNTIRIGTSQTRFFAAGVRGITTGVNNAINVLIDSAGQLGTVSSTRRVKHDIEDMADVSENLLNLRPVTFIYNGDESNTQQFGLIAEEVEAVLPAIVVKDADGQPETVQYHVLPVLLLNEVKKQQAMINAQQEAMKKQEAILAQQDSAVENLTITVEAMNAAISALQTQMQDFIGRTSA
jgi:hypothetical protein